MSNTKVNDNNKPGEIDHGTIYRGIDRHYGQDTATEVVKCLNGIEFEGKTPDVLVAKALGDLKHDLALKAKDLRSRIRSGQETHKLQDEYRQIRQTWYILTKRYVEVYPAALAEALREKHPATCRTATV